MTGKKDITVYELLKKYGLYNPYISRVLYHLNLGNVGSDRVLNKVSANKLLITQQEKAFLIADLIRKCDSSSPEYNSDLDTELIRLGVGMETMYSHNHNDNIFRENDNGVGDNFVSVYEDNLEREGQAEDLKR